jgi:DNA-binding transcriptional LysR family regulator
MELRHLRYFVAVAEERHFGRAAERLNMEQSPLSRAVRELESDLGARLFERTTRRTTITSAGAILLEETRRVFAALDQARDRVRAAAQGHRGHVRIGFYEGGAQLRLARLFALCRRDEPDMELQLLEMPLRQQVQNLRDDLLDVGLIARRPIDMGIVADPVWHDPVVIILSKDHPLAARSEIRLVDAVTEPLLLCDSDSGSGYHWQFEQLIHRVNERPYVAERVGSLSVMMTLAAAGYGIGFSSAADVESMQRPDIAVRPLAEKRARVTTYLIRAAGEPVGPIKRLLQLLRCAT